MKRLILKPTEIFILRLNRNNSPEEKSLENAECSPTFSNFFGGDSLLPDSVSSDSEFDFDESVTSSDSSVEISSLLFSSSLFSFSLLPSVLEASEVSSLSSESISDESKMKKC